MTSLLDVNVLIALADTHHVHHDVVSDWFLAERARSWASCPISENGMIRVMSNKIYENTRDVEDVRNILNRMKSSPGHQFWPDSVSICDTKRITHLHNSKATTDLYLLALAVKNKGQLVTLDSRIKSENVSGSANAFLLLK